jgi:mannose-6-phosphate isomerase-like protein (cupin superfamily)
MNKYLAGSALLLLSASAALAAAPTAATVITGDEVQKVLKLGAKETDHTIRVVDMGQGYQMSVAVVHRGATGAPAPTRTPEQMAAAAAANAKLKDCGAASPIGDKASPMKGGMLSHDFTPETYVIIKGAGTLVTGGKILKGKQAAADNQMVTTLNGPSCTGQVTGGFISTDVKVGDIVVVPAGVPHGWSNIPDMVDYLSIRPDPKHVLPKAGFKYPGL